MAKCAFCIKIEASTTINITTITASAIILSIRYKGIGMVIYRWLYPITTAVQKYT